MLYGHSEAIHDRFGEVHDDDQITQIENRYIQYETSPTVVNYPLQHPKYTSQHVGATETLRNHSVSVSTAILKRSTKIAMDRIPRFVIESRRCLLVMRSPITALRETRDVENRGDMVEECVRHIIVADYHDL